MGFGLSPNGNMFPADVVIGWVKNGQAYFKVNTFLILFSSTVGVVIGATVLLLI